VPEKKQEELSVPDSLWHGWH